MYESYFALEMMMNQRQQELLREAGELHRAGARPKRAAQLRAILAPVLARVGRLMVAKGLHRFCPSGTPPIAAYPSSFSRLSM